METRICSKCKIEKNIEDFSKKRNGYSYYCKECNKEYLKEYYEKIKSTKEYQDKKKRILKIIQKTTSVSGKAYTKDKRVA